MWTDGGRDRRRVSLLLLLLLMMGVDMLKGEDGEPE
jgi:hypothetical protein